jgi:hypothetical protein
MPAASTALGFLASDRELKKDIVPVGEHNGYQWYEFEYKEPEKYGHGRFVGVMADEVEKIKPEAVAVMDNGYKAVHYGML